MFSYGRIGEEFSFPFIIEGIVKATDDPQQMGRLKVWCPALDGEKHTIDELPWSEYASPFAGFTDNFRSGRDLNTTQGIKAYGMWAIPKINSRVFVFLLNGDINRRCYFAGAFPTHLNRSLPRGRNQNPTTGAIGPQTDTYQYIEPAYSNVKEQFQNKLDSDEAQSRGVYERQVAQDKTDKDGKEGYSKSPGEGKEFDYLDPQSYCFVTPGNHALIMSDGYDWCRIRIVTTSGNQILLDDTNERIYISTCKGGNYIELDENGHIHIFGSDDISIRTAENINVRADKNINFEAQKDINLRAIDGSVNIATGGNLNLSITGTIFESSCAGHHINSGGNLVMSAPQIHMNGPTAAEANSPGELTVVPGHEPWSRPSKTKVKRNPKWKK